MFKYVWLNIATGQFSASWDDTTEADMQEFCTKYEIDSEWKLINKLKGNE